MEDLFETFEMLPIDMQQILNAFFKKENTYKNCKSLLKSVNLLGYTFEYGLDSIPYNLQKI